MKFKKALKKLGMGQQLGIEGSDWSWYYKWKFSEYHCSLILVDQDEAPKPLLWCDMTEEDWIIRDADEEK